MIVNKFAKKCQSCNKNVPVGSGFAYINGNRWFTVCDSAACHRRLGLKTETISGEDQSKKITQDGFIYMPFDRAALPLIRSMPGAKFYNKQDAGNPTPGIACWQVSIKPADLPRVLEVCEQLGLEIPDTLRAMRGTDDSRAALVRAERTRKDGKSLYPFQKIGVEFLALHERALLADDMGVGKTPTSLVALPENERVIIICPAAVKYNWRDEIEMWRPDYKTKICNGRDSFVLPEKGEIIILNYDIIPEFFLPTKDSGNVSRKGKPILVADLSEEQKIILSETILIGDEFQIVKNYKAARSKKVDQLSRLCKRVWALTGTPLMNRPLDLFGILCSGNMNPFGTFDRFVRLFNGYKNQWGGYEWGIPSPEVPELLRRVMLRRLKSEVLKDLPPKTYKDIVVDISPESIKKLNKLLGKILKENGEKLENEETESSLASKLQLVNLPLFSQFSEIRALLASSRIPAMLELVETYEESGTPLVVFSAHVQPIEELGKRAGWKIITGGIDAEERRNIVREFQEGSLKGIGLTIGAGGVGITLTHASNALFVDLDWTPSLNLQAEDRLVRIGATADNVLIMRMSSTHPLDKHIQMLLQFKILLAYQALERSIKFKPLKKRPLTQDIKVVDESDEELAARIKATEDEVTREESLGRLQRVASREAVKVNDVPEPPLTPERKVMLREALEYMISRCDGAETRDGMGFSKPDAGLGRWIHDTGLRDEDELPFRVLERILCRYRRQLKGQFEEIWKPE